MEKYAKVMCFAKVHKEGVNKALLDENGRLITVGNDCLIKVFVTGLKFI